jgi:hypothetical protein
LYKVLGSILSNAKTKAKEQTNKTKFKNPTSLSHPESISSEEILLRQARIQKVLHSMI